MGFSLTFPDKGSHLNSITSWGNYSHLKPCQSVVVHREGLRRWPPRPTEVGCCSSGEKHPILQVGKKGWKDGPFGVVWDAEEIAQAANGEVVARGSPGSVSTDSRSINEGEWFLPLVGPNFDGHEFVQQALDRGCAGYIGRNVISREVWPRRGFVRVEGDTLGVLHKLATSVRSRYGGPVVGITGSTGKTTARAMTALALESLGPIHQTEGNFNNLVGLPLTLLKLPSTSSACVLEMGMSHAGEILLLTEIAVPTVRVLLNVGPAHMENFGSLKDVAEAKGEILKEARPGDICVLNADDPLVMSLAIPRGVRVVHILFGSHQGCHVKVADAQATKGGHAVKIVLEQSFPESVFVEDCSSGSQILEQLRENARKFTTSNSQSMSYKTSPGSNLMPRCNMNSQSIQQRQQSTEKCSSPPDMQLVSRMELEIPSPGLHLVINACAAAAVAVSLGVPLENVVNSLSKYSPIGMRSRLEIIGGVQLIDDTYNSNPMSLESALKLLGSMDCKGGRRVALLGDMLELGSVSKRAHMDALALCTELKLDIVALVGPCFLEAVAASSSGLLKEESCIIYMFEDAKELAAKVMEIWRPGDVVLVKGSRGMKMEIAAHAIRTMALSE
ncbi:unnamed protein product [Calypogeia fissa]